MSVKDIADDLVKLCRDGKFDQASEKYHSDDIVSIEAMGPPGMDLEARGKAAVAAKGEWWANNHEVLSSKVEGPFINGDQFAVKFDMDVKQKASGQQHHMSEVALYTVKNGKVVEERFLYAM